MPNKQLFNILFSPHCSVRGLEPSPALNTEPGVFLQAFRRSHPEWGSALRVFTVKHPRFPNGKLRNEKKKNVKKSELQLLVSSSVPVKPPPRACFSGPLHKFKAQLPPGAPCGCASSALLQLAAQARTFALPHSSAFNFCDK